MKVKTYLNLNDVVCPVKQSLFDECKRIYSINCITKLKKTPITSRKLLIVLFCGLGFLLFLNFKFEQ